MLTFKSVEFKYTSIFNNTEGDGISKVEFSNEKICIIEKSSISVFKLFNEEHIEQIFLWKTKVDSEYILDGTWINDDILLLVTNYSIYVINLQKFSVNEFTVPFFSGKRIQSVDLIHLIETQNQYNNKYMAVLALCSCSGLFLVSLTEDDLSVNFGRLTEHIHTGKLFQLEEYMYFTDGVFINKYSLDIYNLEYKLLDSINIGEILSESIGSNYKLLSVMKSFNENNEIIITFVNDKEKSSAIKLKISNISILPICISKISIKDNLVDFSILSINNIEIYFATYVDNITVWDSSKSESCTRQTLFNDAFLNFRPFISRDIRSSNTLYICLGKKEGKWYLNLVKYEDSSILLKECDDFNSSDLLLNKDKNKLKEYLEMLSIYRNRASTPLKDIIDAITYYITLYNEDEYDYIIDYILNIPFFDYDEAKVFYFDLISILERINKSSNITSTLNDLIHKLATFSYINSNNEQKTEMAISICNSDISEITGGNSVYKWCTLWKRFTRCDIWKLGICYLLINSVSEFFILFNRHSFQFGNGEEKIRSDLVLESLENIPVLIPDEFEKRMPFWLNNQVFPLVLDRDRLLNWISHRAIALEHVTNGDIHRCIFFLSSIFQKDLQFPINNLFLPKQIVTNGILWAGSGDKRYHIRKTSSNKINKIYISLLECMDLKEKYNLDIRFNSLFSDKVSSKEIAYSLLNRVERLEILRQEIQENFIPFCRQRGIDSDFMLVNYILDMISLIKYKRTYKNEQIDNNYGVKSHLQSCIIVLIDSIIKVNCKSHVLLRYFSVFNKYCSSLKSDKIKNNTTSVEDNFEYLLNYARNLKLDGRRTLELKNRISLIDAQNLLSRYSLDHMASVVLFEKNASRRLLLHVISQVEVGMESFKDALSLLSYLEQETNVSIMSITEAFCLRLRFITFRRSLISKINESVSRNEEIISKTKDLEYEILDLLSTLDFEKRYNVTQQFTCFIWQFTDQYAVSDYSSIFKVKCILAVFSAIVVLRDFLKFTQKNDIKLKHVTFWASNESLSTLLRLQTLQTEFGIFLRPSDIVINKINHDNELSTEISHTTINSASITTLDDINCYYSKNSEKILTCMNQSFRDWEWDSDYYHIYNESCYSKICEMFDQYSKPLIENDIQKNKKGRLTKLLRLGGLIGVDESYVRRSLIRHSITSWNKLSIFKRLTQELVKSPSPKNSMIIIDEVQNIILNLHTINSEEFQHNKLYSNNQNSDIDPFELSFIISELLKVLAYCILFCPTSVISFVLSLSGDILWVYDFLIQASDIIDNLEYSESSLFTGQETEHIFTKLLMNLSRRKSRTNIQVNLKESYYKEVCTLYPSSNAITMALKFLANKITLRKELYKHISLKRAYISSVLSTNFCIDPGWWPINCELDVDINVSNILESFMRYINNFLQQLYQLECLSLSTSLYLRHPEMILDLSLVLNINIDFFRKVLKGKDPMDGQLCMALSSSLEKKDSWNVFVQSLTPSNILDNYYRAQRMARIGWDLGILYNHYSMRREMEDLYKQSKWCNFFRQVGVDFDQSLFFQKQDPKNNIQNEYKRNILQKIIFKNNFELISCLQFARDYNINDEYVIKLWTEKMILYFSGYRFEPKMLNILNIVTPELGREIFNSTFNFIPSCNYERLLFILNWYLEKSRELTTKSLHNYNDPDEIHLTTCSSSVNNYEQELSCEIPILSKLEIVKILSTHKRICCPDSEEIEFINHELERLRKRNPENWDEMIATDLFIQLKYRIPFHYLIRFPLKALKYEINDETIYKMKLLLQNLGIKKVSIDVQFVWNIVSCRKYMYYKNNNSEETKKYSKESDQYYSNLIEDDKILLRYIDSIGSFDLETGIAVLLLIIDELPLSITKIKLIEWYESINDNYSSIELKKGYPLTKIEGINYDRYNEVMSNAGDFLRYRKSLVLAMLILERHKLNEIFSCLLETTNDVSHFIFTLYYYLTPLISEGLYRKHRNSVQREIIETFCNNSGDEPPVNILDKCHIQIENIAFNSKLVNRFNKFIDEISSAYSIETRKIRISLIKNMLNKPFETPYEALKNKFSEKIRNIFNNIENSSLIIGFEYWFVNGNSFFPNFYNKFLIDRISFICEGINSSDSILLLLSISFKNTTNYSFSTKCNALKALFQVASTKNIQKRYPKYNDLKVIWLHNYYMIFFHELHIPQDFSKFYLSEKVGLAKSLWREYESRKLSEPIYSKTKNKANFEEYRFLALSNEKENKLRCIQNEKEIEHLHFSSSSGVLLSNAKKGRHLNNILYLIAEMCIDFGISDSKLFSNTILDLYKRLDDELDVKLLRDILFASYTSGFIYRLSPKKILIDSWLFLLADPISNIQAVIENFLNSFLKTDFYDNKISETSTFDLDFLFKIPIHHNLIAFFSYVCNECPIIPFIRIEEYIDILANLSNSVFELMTAINSNKRLGNIYNSNSLIFERMISFFKKISEELLIYNKIQYKKKEMPNEPEYKDIISVLEVFMYILLSIAIKPIDLHLGAYSSDKSGISSRIVKNVNKMLYPYIICASNSEFLISFLSLEFAKTHTPGHFFKKMSGFIDFVGISKKKYIEDSFLMSCVVEHRVYEYIEYKSTEYNVSDYVSVIKKCIKHYGIESVIPYIIKLLSGETSSENEILEKLRILENEPFKQVGKFGKGAFRTL